jgi:DnaJ domain
VDHYDTLGVARGAPAEVIRAAYRVLVQKHHPDKQGGSNGKASAINEAYRILSDTALRAAYDSSLEDRAREPPQSPVARPMQPRPTGFRKPVLVDERAAKHDFTLHLKPGRIIGNNEWVEQTVTSKGGGGFAAYGFGYTRAPKISTTNVERQRIAVRLDAGHDVFLHNNAGFASVADAQLVDVVYCEGSRHAPWPIGIINRSSGAWYLFDAAVGEKIARSAAKARDTLLYLGVVVGLSLAAWYGFAKARGFLAWVVFFLLGVPIIIGACFPLYILTTDRINRAVQAAVGRLARLPP